MKTKSRKQDNTLSLTFRESDFSRSGLDLEIWESMLDAAGVSYADSLDVVMTVKAAARFYGGKES